MIVPWPLPVSEDLRPVPAFKMRPCDYGLRGAITALETELGSYEAYNRLVSAALLLKEKVESGKGETQNPCYADGSGALRK